VRTLVGDLNPFSPRASCAFLRIQAVLTALVDSNSTRTESCVAIRPDPEAQTRVDAPKATDRNGYQQIIRPSRGKGAGLKILVSAVQSRPSPPFHFCVDSYLHAADFQQLARHTFRLGRNLADHARLGASLIGMTVRSPG
jgi:hypothetical protein